MSSPASGRPFKLDNVIGFGSDVAAGWVVLQSDGKVHLCAEPIILHWLQVACAHSAPVELEVEPDPFGTVSYVAVRLDQKKERVATMSSPPVPPNARKDTVVSIGSDVNTAWVVLASDGKAHLCANATILQQLQVSAAHQTPVMIVVEPDPFGTISYAYVTFA
jgi:hypothetical protein